MLYPFKSDRRMAEKELSNSNINYSLDKFAWRIDYRTKSKVADGKEENNEKKLDKECLLLEFTLSNRNDKDDKHPLILEVKKTEFAKMNAKIEGARNELMRYL